MMEEKPVYPIEFAYAKGKYVYFRYLTEEDARGEWHLWFNSPYITHFMPARRWVNTVDEQIKYLEYIKSTRDKLILAVVDVATNVHIGVCSLGSIDYINRHAELSCVIGNKEFHKGQHALETLAMMTEIGFVRLNLHKIYATTVESNKKSLELTKFLGYEESGHFKEHCFVNDRYEGVVILEILQSDWLKSNRRPKGI